FPRPAVGLPQSGVEEKRSGHGRRRSLHGEQAMWTNVGGWICIVQLRHHRGLGMGAEPGLLFLLFLFFLLLFFSVLLALLGVFLFLRLIFWVSVFFLVFFLFWRSFRSLP